uniref:Uncharacterized protein n=1 Tax=Amphimedon queenslandica TaxID=400682 RepID=A0A1X7TD88_AMPQE
MPRVVFLSLLFFLVIYRAIATLFSNMNITLHVCGPQEIIFGYYVCHGEIKSSDVACVLIWISVTVISGSLVQDIIKKGLGQSPFKDFHKILSLLSIISYEIWMFGYIYHTYVTEFDWNFQLIIFLPLLALLAHSIFQAFLSYDKYVLPNNEQGTVYFIVTSFGFNGIMMVHVLCMFITALSTGISKEENFMYATNVLFLGLGEIMNRGYVMYKQFKQAKNRIPYSISVKESHRANPDGELVIGQTQDRGDIAYLTATVLVVAAVGATCIVAGKLGKAKF